MRFLPDVAGMCGFVSFVVVLVFNKGKSLNDGDTFWHLAAGRHMLENGVILTQDIFSHTAFGKSWTAHEWLSEIIMAWLHQHFGLTGTVLFFFLIAALTFWLLFRLVSTVAGDWAAAFAVSLALIFSMRHMLVRPHIFSWLFGVITLYALHKQGRWLWILPLLTILWTNLHGGFILGLALQGLFIGGAVLDGLFSGSYTKLKSLFGKVKCPSIFFALSILATGINPFGFKLLIFPFLVSSKVFSTGIHEWLPANLQHDRLFRAFLLSFLLLMSLRSTPTTWTDRLFAVFFFNAALMHQRYKNIASIFLCPYFALALKSLPWNKLKLPVRISNSKQVQTSASSGPLITITLAFLLIFVSGPGHPYTQTILQRFIPIPVDKHPIEAINFLNQTTLSGKMFNKYSWGGYLIYALEPKQKVFIDGRADMYGEDIFGDYQKIVSLDKEAEELLDRYDVDWVLFPIDSVLIRYLKVTGKWQEIYSDDMASILIRRPESPT